jgi:hypothetical protein
MTKVFFNSLLTFQANLLFRLKETASRDVRPLVFSKSITPRHLISTLKYFLFLVRIRRDIRLQTFVQRYAA